MEKEMEEGRVDATTSSGSERTRRANDPEGSIPGETENTTVREWREGRHLVREYHPNGPGEEVGLQIALHTSSLTSLLFSGPCRGYPQRL